MTERGEVDFQSVWLAPEVFHQIVGACQRCGMERLKPIQEALPEEISLRADSPGCGSDEAHGSGVVRMSE